VPLWDAYGLALAACGGGAAYGLAEAGAGDDDLVFERLPKRDRFCESRSSPLSFLPRPKGMVGGCCAERWNIEGNSWK
jgi:hypothetical protein